MTRLNVGVVGLGLGQHHAAAFSANELVERLVLCDPDQQRVAAVRRDHPTVAQGYPNLEAMLDAEHLDVVSIVTPDHLHREHAERCLAAGCHVVLTKPLATNLEDGRAIVRAAEKASRVLMVAHERRYRSRYVAIKQMLDAGQLGQIVHLRIDAIQDKREQFRRAPWYASAEAGRTALVGSGIHEVDLLRYLIAKPIEAVCAASNRMGTLEFPQDKTTAATYRFAGGTIGQVTVTYEAHWPKTGQIDDHFRLLGTKGLIVGDQAAHDDQEGWRTLPSDESPTVTGTNGCVTAFLKAVVEGAPVEVDGRGAFASLAACVAADESAASGEPCVPARADFA